MARRRIGSAARRSVAARWSEAEARRALGAWRGSGLSLAAWCRREGVGYERIRRWRRRLTPAARRHRSVAAVLPVQVLEHVAAREAQGFELELSRGRRLRIPSRFDEEMLVRLLRVVEASA